MSHVLKILTVSTYLQFLNYTRIKQAIFFTMVFPVLLFFLFGNIWGVSDSDYLYFLFTGVIAATSASDGLFATGPVIKGYYDNNLIKFFRNLPFNVMLHFFGLFLSRVAIMLCSTMLLILCFTLVFSASMSWWQCMLSLTGMILGFVLFSLIGLLLSFYSKENAGRGGVAGFLYFLMLFATDVYYPVSEMNSLFAKFTYIFPMTYLLDYMRGDVVSLFPVVGWIVVLSIIFYGVFTKSQVTR